jgi:hypothetical protein
MVLDKAEVEAGSSLEEEVHGMGMVPGILNDHGCPSQRKASMPVETTYVSS